MLLAAVTRRAGAIEDLLSPSLQRIERRIGIGQRLAALAHRERQSPHTRRRKLRALESGKFVEPSRTRELLCAGVTLQRCDRLVLQPVDASVALISAIGIRPELPGRLDPVGARDRYI